MVHKPMLFTFYTFDMNKVNAYFHIFMKLLQQHVPKLYAVFIEQELECSIFLYEWSLSAFSNVLPLTLVSRLWDQWLMLDELSFFRISMSIC